MKATKKALFLFTIFTSFSVHATLLEQCVRGMKSKYQSFLENEVQSFIENEYQSFIENEYDNLLNELREEFPNVTNPDFMSYLNLDIEMHDHDFEAMCVSSRENQLNHLREVVNLGYLNFTGNSEHFFPSEGFIGSPGNCRVNTSLTEDRDGNEILRIKIDALATVDIVFLSGRHERYRRTIDVSLDDIGVYSLSDIDVGLSNQPYAGGNDTIRFNLTQRDGVVGPIDNLSIAIHNKLRKTHAFIDCRRY